MKVLHLTLKKKWFDMIASGEKTEEYREIKPFWEKRFVSCYNNLKNQFPSTVYPELCIAYTHSYDVVHFVNGGNFHSSHPSQTLQCTGIEIREGNPEWGAEPGKKYFVIKLGERI